MDDQILYVDSACVSLSVVGIRLKCYGCEDRQYLSLEVWADSADLSGHFVAINGFTVADCTNAFDLQGRSFRLDGNTQEIEPEGEKACGELLESALGNSLVDPLMFESILLKFGKLENSHIAVEIVADAFNSERSGVPVRGNLIALIHDDAT